MVQISTVTEQRLLKFGADLIEEGYQLMMPTAQQCQCTNCARITLVKQRMIRWMKEYKEYAESPQETAKEGARQTPENSNQDKEPNPLPT